MNYTQVRTGSETHEQNYLSEGKGISGPTNGDYSLQKKETF